MSSLDMSHVFNSTKLMDVYECVDCKMKDLMKTVQQRVAGEGGSVHVWGAFHSNGKSDLVIFGGQHDCVSQHPIGNTCYHGLDR